MARTCPAVKPVGASPIWLRWVHRAARRCRTRAGVPLEGDPRWKCHPEAFPGAPLPRYGARQWRCGALRLLRLCRARKSVRRPRIVLQGPGGSGRMGGMIEQLGKSRIDTCPGVPMSVRLGRLLSKWPYQLRGTFFRERVELWQQQRRHRDEQRRQGRRC